MILNENSIVSEDGTLFLKGCATLKNDIFPSLDIYINRTFYKTILADKLIEDNLYGFALMLPEEIILKEENIIAVKFHNTNRHLANSPLIYKHKAKYIFGVGLTTKEQVGGWILDENFKNRTLNLKLFINNEFVMKTKNSNNRKDIESIYGVLKAGFHFDIPEKYQNLKNLKIEIKVLDSSKLINLLHKSIVVKSDNEAPIEDKKSSYIRVQKVWDTLNSEYNPFIKKDILKLIKKEKEFSFLLQDTLFIKNMKDFKKILSSEKKLVQGLNKEYISALMLQENKDDIMLKCVNTVIKNNSIKLKSFLSADILTSQETFVINNTNYIRFYDQEEVFYILQHINFIDAIYFPKRQMLIAVSSGGGASLENIKQFIYKVFNDIDIFINYINTKDKVFGGAIFSHGRPYHALYNNLIAAQKLYDNGILEKVKYSVSIIDEWNYFDLIKIFPELKLKYKTITKNIKNTIKDLLIHKEFFLMPASRSTDILWEKQSLKNRLIGIALKNIDDVTYINLKKAESCFPLVWIGVIGQKRIWVEQEDGCIYIINELSKKYPNLGIVFDGWTRNEFQIKNKIIKNEIFQDRLIVKNIKKQINENIVTFNLIGETPLNKIAFAKHINLFIANHGTGSMYVSCIAEKVGISHNSNSFRKVANELHYHYETYEVDAEDVKDIEIDAKRISEGNYSIDSKKILNKVNIVLDKYYNESK